MNSSLFLWYERTFSGWPVALCCFSNAEATKATPMLWWYEPRDETRLFAPAVDCHTGGIPDLAASVRVEHWGVLGSSRLTAGAEVKYTDHVPSGLAPYLPKRVIGRWFGGPMPNGDFVARVEDVRRGELHVGREIPPAA